MLLKLLMLALIGWYLYSQIEWNTFFRTIRAADPSWMLAAAVCYGTTTLLGIIRWQVLLGSAGVGLRWLRTAQLTLIGLFANLFLPGSMGGDLLKAYFAGREIPEKRTTLLMSIVMERLLGFIAMFAVSTALILSRYDRLTAEPATRVAVYLYFVFFSLIVGLIAIGMWRKLGEWFPFGKTIWKRFPFQEVLHEAADAYQFFMRHPACFRGGLLLSAVAHFTLMGTFYCVSRALHMTIAFWDLAAVLPLIMMVSMIPVTPNGVGLRELAFSHFLQFAHMTEESSIALSLGGTMVIYLWALAGGLVFLKFRSRPSQRVS